MTSITKTKTSITSKRDTNKLTAIAMLAATSFILAFIEMPVPLAPAFARFDVSDLPALIGAFAYGPMAGLIIELVKNSLQLFSSGTGGIGELANFIMGSSYVVTAGYVYQWKKTKKGALIGCIAGSVVMGIVAAIVNYFILLPLFESFMPIDQLIASFQAFIPFIHSKLDIVLYNALPFNLLKGLAIGAITMMIYQPLRPILKGRV